MKIGIDKIGIHIPKYYLDIKDLAEKRGVDPNKYLIGLGLNKMSITCKSQDIVSMATMAADKILDEEDKKDIDMIIVGTETGVDQSKSSSAFMHSLLGINEFCRSIEIKQACYGATAALLLARAHILENENSKVLVIATDIAKYGINTAGEATQGAGAVAMLITKNPRILEISNEKVSYTKDVMDFFRPNNSIYAIARGKLSTETYLDSLEKVYKEFERKYGKKDYSAICLHVPYPKLAFKGLKRIEKENLETKLQEAVKYNKEVGNIYTGSLFLSLVSLLDNVKFKEGDIIGLYSYGSGAVSEFFTMKIVEGYEKYLRREENKKLFENRIRLSVLEYETKFFEEVKEDIENENIEGEEIYLKGIFNNERKYERKI